MQRLSNNLDSFSDDEEIMKELMIADPRYYYSIKKEFKKQLLLMPLNEKRNLKFDLIEAKKEEYKIKNICKKFLCKIYLH